MKDELKHQLADSIRLYNRKGWSPATSTNYSFKMSPDAEEILISRSGVDKAEFVSEDFMEVNTEGEPINASIAFRPSAETGIHCAIYKLFPKTTCVLHSHSVYPVLWSLEANHLTFAGYEILKGFDGITTHETSVKIPVLPNSQDMVMFQSWIEERQDEMQYHCFVIKGHGTYAWGKSLIEAKRHLETLDYLCEVEWKRLKNK